MERILEPLPTKALIDAATYKGWDRFIHQVEMKVIHNGEEIKYLPRVTINLIHEWVMKTYGYYAYVWRDRSKNNKFFGSFSDSSGNIGSYVSKPTETYEQSLINVLIYILTKLV